MPDDFWGTVDPKEVLTDEETAFISTSSADRYQLAEEIVLYKKMLELLGMATDRHRAAISSGAIEKDACGYDGRLDVVGVQAQFAAFIKGPDGEALFKAGRLDDEGMCRKRKCKPHNGWLNLWTRHVRFQTRELAREAKMKLDAETRVRDSAAERFLRRRHEENWAVAVESDGGEQGK